MEDRLRRAATPEERQAAIRELRTRMVSHEQLARNHAAAGQARSSDALEVKYDRLEADQLLAEAGVDPAKEPPIAEPKANPARPPPAPPSPTPSVQRRAGWSVVIRESRRLALRVVPASLLARFGPTTPTRFRGLPLTPMCVRSALMLPHLALI